MRRSTDKPSGKRNSLTIAIMKRILILTFTIGLALLVLQAGQPLRAQRVVGKTNLLYWATGTPNLGVEVALNGRNTLALQGGWQPWQYSDTKKMKHWALQPEWKYWFCETFNGHYLGLHALGGQYNVGGINLPFGLLPTLDDHRYQGYRSFTDGHSSWTEEDGMQQEAAPTTSMEDCGALLKSRNWALKASLGTSLPQGDFCAPLTADLSVERHLTKRLALEAGVQYNRLAGHGEETLHTLGVPVKLNILLAQSSKVDFYAQLGGMVEKCVSGAPDNSFAAEPVQGSLLAGLGVSYKLSDRLALFAEPSVSHHFDSDASTRTLRTERALNVNLLCGLRMTY